MKRVLSAVLAVLALLALAVPAFALGSMTDPVEIVDTVTPTATPEPTPEPTASPEPTPAPTETPAIAEPTDTVRGEITGTEPLPTTEPEEVGTRTQPTEAPRTIEELIETWGIADPEVPLAAYNAEPGAAWSVVNLICTVLSVGFGAAATGAAVKVNRLKEELQSGDKKYTLIRKEKTRTENGTELSETQFVQKSKLWKSGFYDLISSAGSVVTFLLTENMLTPMCLTDRWTPLMASILAVSAAVYGVTAGGKKLSTELADSLLAAGSKKE